MRFDMSRAWNDAVGSVSANREVLLVIAGVFFLLPGLAFTFFFSGTMANLLASLPQGGSGPVLNEGALANLGWILFVVLLAISLVQMVGYTAMLALLDDKERPTVGEALSRAVKFLPTLIGMLLALLVAYVVLALVLGITIGALIVASQSTGLAFLLAAILLVAVSYLLTRLSLSVAVVVFEDRYNPFTAIARSWSLTGKDSFRLFGFYVLLFVVYLVTILIVGIVAGAIGGLLGPGSVGLIVVGLISGSVGTVANTIFIAIVAAVYRQFAGPSTGSLNETFG